MYALKVVEARIDICRNPPERKWDFVEKIGNTRTKYMLSMYYAWTINVIAAVHWMFRGDRLLTMGI
jgi:hypothetical protein